jgi:hypothetical protein
MTTTSHRYSARVRPAGSRSGRLRRCSTFSTRAVSRFPTRSAPRSPGAPTSTGSACGFAAPSPRTRFRTWTTPAASEAQPRRFQAGLLDKRGLIDRSPSPGDERSVIVAVTDAGRELVERVLQGHVDCIRRLLFDAMADGDLAAPGDVLGRVREHMPAAPPRSARPRPVGAKRHRVTRVTSASIDRRKIDPGFRVA